VGICSLVPRSNCEPSGVYLGIASTCDTADCGQFLRACCGADGGCFDFTPAACDLLDGKASEDRTCDTTLCIPFGSCCLAEGTCSELDQLSCGLQGGALVVGGECATEDCATPQACCKPDGACTETPPGNCTANLNGMPKGEGSLCAFVTCPLPD
jgi:hypothetical protein